jgi:hypothetical protein
VKPEERVNPYEFCCIILEIVYMGFDEDRHVCMGFLKETFIHLKIVSYMGCTVDNTFPGLFVVVFL